MSRPRHTEPVAYTTSAWTYLIATVLRADDPKKAKSLLDLHVKLLPKEDRRLALIWKHELSALERKPTRRALVDAILTTKNRAMSLHGPLGLHVDQPQSLPQVLAAHLTQDEAAELLEGPEETKAFEEHRDLLDQLAIHDPVEFAQGPLIHPDTDLVHYHKSTISAVQDSFDALCLILQRAVDHFRDVPNPAPKVVIEVNESKRSLSVWFNGQGVQATDMVQEFAQLGVTTPAEQQRGMFRRSIKDLRGLGRPVSIISHDGTSHSELVLKPDARYHVRSVPLDPETHGFQFPDDSKSLAGTLFTIQGIPPHAFTPVEVLRTVVLHFSLRGGHGVGQVGSINLCRKAGADWKVEQLLDLVKAREAQEATDTLVKHVRLDALGGCDLKIYKLEEEPPFTTEARVSRQADHPGTQRHGILVQSERAAHELTSWHPNLEAHACVRQFRAVLTAPVIDTLIRDFQSGKEARLIISCQTRQSTLDRHHPVMCETWHLVYKWYHWALETWLDGGFKDKPDVTENLDFLLAEFPDLKNVAKFQRIHRTNEMARWAIQEVKDKWNKVDEGALKLAKRLKTQPEGHKGLVHITLQVVPKVTGLKRGHIWQLQGDTLVVRVSGQHRTRQQIVSEVATALVDYLQTAALARGVQALHGGLGALKVLQDIHKIWVPLFRSITTQWSDVTM